MGQTISSPLVPPPLIDASEDDSKEDGYLRPNSAIAKKEESKDGKADDISIVFVEDDEDEDDLYYDDRDDGLCTDQFRCFGVPFLGSIHPPLFTMGPAIVPVDPRPKKGTVKVNANIDEDEDEDPREGIESLQQELKAVDEIYNHEGDNDDDDDLREDVEMLQRELQEAEKNYVPPEKNTATGDKYDCGGSEHTLLTDGHHSRKSPSFINLQQLLFRSGDDDDDNDGDQSSITNAGSVSSSATVSLLSSSSTTCRIVEIYETRTTQLRPQPESEKEKVPIERMGVPFRKCCDPSCSCHHSTSRSKHGRSRNRRQRNRAIIEKHHSNINDNDNDVEVSSPIDEQHLKRINVLQRLQKQRDKLLAMAMDEDDQSEVTTESSVSSSRYGGCSTRSDCQINTRRNHHHHPDISVNDHGRRRQRSFSVDQNKGSANAVLSMETAVPAAVPVGSSAIATTPSPHLISPQFPSSSNGNANTTLVPQTKQQSPQPPLPLRRSFGASSNDRQKTYPSMTMQNNSSRCLRPDPLAEANDNEITRRCRSEDFIDGNGSNMFCSYARSRGAESNTAVSKDSAVESSIFRSKTKQQSLHLHNASVDKSTQIEDRDGHANIKGSVTSTDQSHVDEVADTKEGDDPSLMGSPTCIMEEIHRTDSFQRYRTTQHDPQQLSEQHDPPSATTSGNESPARKNCDDRNDQPRRSRLFDEREKSLKELRQSLRFLQNQEKMNRRQIYSATQTTLNKTYRKHQKRRRQKQQQREFERSMQLADLYHNMGLIHYQQARYDTARHVLQCGIDTLISHRASSVPFATVLHEETTDPFDDDYFDPFASCSSTTQLLPPLPTLNEAAPYLANTALLLAAELVLVQGKIFAAQGFWNETKESSGKVLQWSDFQQQRMLGQSTSHRRPEDNHHQTKVNSRKYWTQWGPTRARAQVLFARCFEQEHRPDFAMRHYREALSVQQCVLGPWHVQAADTLYRMGTLHAASGMLGLAGHCYEEALGLYRRHLSRAPNSAPPRLPEHNHLGYRSSSDSLSSSMACVAADEATVLAGLGWIFLVQRDPRMALVLTNQALDGMVHALGPSHTNVLALHQQLACIQSSLAAANQHRNHLQQPIYGYPPNVQASSPYPLHAQASYRGRENGTQG